MRFQYPTPSRPYSGTRASLAWMERASSNHTWFRYTDEYGGGHESKNRSSLAEAFQQLHMSSGTAASLHQLAALLGG